MCNVTSTIQGFLTLLFLLFGFQVSAQSEAFQVNAKHYFEYKTSNKEKAQGYLNLAFEELKADNNKTLGKDQGLIYYNKAYQYYNDGDYKSSLNCFFNAERNFSFSKDSCLLKDALFNIGNVISVLGNNKAAIQYFIASNDIKDCSNNGTSDILYHYNLGLLFSSIDQHSEALKHFEKALTFDKKIGSDKLNLYLSQLAANSEKHKLGLIKDAITGHLLILKDSFSQKYPEDLLYYGYSELGSFYLDNQQIDSAKFYFKLAKNIEKTAYKEEYELMDLLNQTSLELAAKRYASAIEYGRKSLGLSKELGNIERSKKSLVYLVEAYENSNQWKDAFLYLSNLSQLVDSIHQENTKLDYLISEISKSKRIEKLLETQVSKSTVEINTLNLFLIWLASISIVCIVFLVFLFLAKRKKDHLYKKLDISNQNKDKIFRTLTHDIRTPLLDINNVLDLFQMEVITEDHRNTIVNTIREKVEHLRLNVDSILQWSIGQIKGAKVKKESNSTRELITTAKDFVSNQSSLKDVEINITEALDDYIVNVDSSQMHIILRNVFGNAIKFSDRGSKILVRTGQKPKYTYIEIEDFGKGMSDQEIKKILSDEQYTNDPSKLGVGVGLKLVKEYLAINNGELTIQSTPKKGSTFIIKIFK